jgi:hypothetical protein
MFFLNIAGKNGKRKSNRLGIGLKDVVDVRQKT